MSSKGQAYSSDKISSNQQPPIPATDNLAITVQQPSLSTTLIQQVRSNSRRFNPGQVLRLQDAVGNQAVQRLLQSREKVGASSINDTTADFATLQRYDPDEEVAPPVVVTDDDRTEFGHLRLRTGRADNTNFTSIEDYVTYRDRHFGSRAEYIAVRTVADAEWDANRPIRNRVGQSGDNADRKKALYRWLRFEYRIAGIDTAPAIVALMQQGMTPELQAIVNRVRGLHPALQIGGFVARPRKHTGIGYRLGTLSEHGTGRAFDIKPQSDNPQIPVASWQVIERLAGGRVERNLRRWRTDAMALWQDIHDLNQEYQTAVTRSVSEIQAAREAAGKDPNHPNPLNEVLSNSWLFHRATKHGLSFFTLTQDLILAMHREGLVWGVTFETPDLHHFELP